MRPIEPDLHMIDIDDLTIELLGRLFFALLEDEHRARSRLRMSHAVLGAMIVAPWKVISPAEPVKDLQRVSSSWTNCVVPEVIERHARSPYDSLLALPLWQLLRRATSSQAIESGDASQTESGR